ncbi:DUF6602 domain-containing protein [Nitrospirillum sp. BR 11828]|uniref:DUF6602 domain-containing protein n=1 Tax=Nitrospirillum sp. BR 11828 TaxID=3104325 RepID=UPI002ACAAA66|nr:DUF6602 domain-containing protein [Nitrospirillum sp. BR 11828]MDZ5650335.1 DUF6602 domain-containing protein [Nitrospirillum sp. BR 11828]
MSKITRNELFRLAAKKLRADFVEAKAVPHNGLRGSELEEVVKNFFKEKIPKRFDVAGGIIIDQLDQTSKQSDIIIYDSLNCPSYRASNSASIIPSDNAAVVIEVKAKIDKQKLREAFEHARSVKSLAKTAYSETSSFVTTQTMFCLFAFDTPLKLNKILEHYREMIVEFGIGYHIDVIMILDKGVITLAGKIDNIQPWTTLMLQGFGGPKSEGTHIAASAVDAGENSLDMLFRYILVHLMHFRAMTGHPGFDWKKDNKEFQMAISYITSITHENEPARRNEILRQYQEKAIADLEIIDTNTPNMKQ